MNISILWHFYCACSLHSRLIETWLISVKNTSEHEPHYRPCTQSRLTFASCATHAARFAHATQLALMQQKRRILLMLICATAAPTWERSAAYLSVQPTRSSRSSNTLNRQKAATRQSCGFCFQSRLLPEQYASEQLPDQSATQFDAAVVAKNINARQRASLKAQLRRCDSFIQP